MQRAELRVSPSIRTTRWQRVGFSTLALTRRAKTTRSGELSMVFERPSVTQSHRRGGSGFGDVGPIIGAGFTRRYRKTFHRCFPIVRKRLVNDHRAHLHSLPGASPFARRQDTLR